MDNYIKKIEAITAKTGWTQAQFAQEIGVTFATVNRWLNKHTKPHAAQLKQIDKLHRNIVGIIPLAQAQIKQILEQIDAKKKAYPQIIKIIQQEKIKETLSLELT